MKKDLSKKVAGLRQGLQVLLDKGFYETTVQVCDFKATMHILTDGEEILISQALKDVDFVTREKMRVVEFLAHAVSQVGDMAFETLEEARDFFSLCTEPLRNEFAKAYQSIVPKGEEQIKALMGELKNSPGVQMASASGS